MQTTSLSWGGSGGAMPPPAPDAGPAYTDDDATETATAIAVTCHRRRAGVPPVDLKARVSLFLGPTGLAVGLAPKERRYGRVRPTRPRTTSSTSSPWFPRSATDARGGFGSDLSAGSISPDPPRAGSHGRARLSSDGRARIWRGRLFAVHGIAAGDEDLRSDSPEPPARLVRRGRGGQDSRTPRHTSRGCAPRQEQARVHAPLRYGRLRDRPQRRQGQGQRQQARRQAVLPPQRLSGRPSLPDPRRDASAPARGGRPQGGEGNAAAESLVPPAASQAQGLRRGRAPPRGPKAQADGDRGLMAEEERNEEQSEETQQGAREEAPPEASGEGAPAAQERISEEPEDSQDEARDQASEEGKSDLPPGAELEPIAIEPQRELSAEERARLEAEAEERARAEAEATAEAGEEPAPAREAVVDLDSEARIQATGKRKTSIARVVLRSGSGEFQINKRSLEDYFPRHQHQTFVRQPLLTSGYEGKVDVRVRVHGGGIAGQAGAVRHGIARALTEIDPELRGELKRRGLLTRDDRAKERRKAGLKKARKRPQFSKR